MLVNLIFEGGKHEPVEFKKRVWGLETAFFRGGGFVARIGIGGLFCFASMLMG